MGRHRCRHMVVAEILGALEGEPWGLLLSHLARRARLPLDRARRLLSELEGAGLVYRDPAARRYLITWRGSEWLGVYRVLREIYDPYAARPANPY